MSTIDTMRELLATYQRCQVVKRDIVLTVAQVAEMVAAHDAWKQRAERAEAAVDVQQARVAMYRGQRGLIVARLRDALQLANEGAT